MTDNQKDGMLTIEDLSMMFGEDEMFQIAGTGPREFRDFDRPRIEEAIGHASALVRGYIRDRWPSALTGTPMLKGVVADIARWRLRGRGGQQSAMNATVQRRYDEAMARLNDLAAGKMALDLPDPEASSEAAIAAADSMAVRAGAPASRVKILMPEFLS